MMGTSTARLEFLQILAADKYLQNDISWDFIAHPVHHIPAVTEHNHIIPSTIIYVKAGPSINSAHIPTARQFQ